MVVRGKCSEVSKARTILKVQQVVATAWAWPLWLLGAARTSWSCLMPALEREVVAVLAYYNCGNTIEQNFTAGSTEVEEAEALLRHRHRPHPQVD